MKLLSLTLVSLLTLPSLCAAGAMGNFSPDPKDLGWDIPNDIKGHPFAFSSSQDPDALKRTNALSVTLVAMNDGVPAGGIVAAYLEKNKIPIKFVAMEGDSRLDDDIWNDGKNPAIYLNESLPPYPRVYAPLLAREGAKLVYDDMLDTAERRYMIRSLEVRSWIELGGDSKNLPVIEHLVDYKNAALAARFKTWLDNDSQTALHKIGKETDTVTIPEAQAEMDRAEKEAQAKGEIPAEWKDFLSKIRAALKENNKRFVDFLIAESGWKKMYPGR